MKEIGRMTSRKVRGGGCTRTAPFTRAAWLVERSRVREACEMVPTILKENGRGTSVKERVCRCTRMATATKVHGAPTAEVDREGWSTLLVRLMLVAG